MKRRVHTLLIPYLLWNAIAFLALTGYAWLRARSFTPSLAEAFMGRGGLTMFWNNSNNTPIDYPLWFVRDLIIFVAISPLVYLFARYLREYGLILIFLGYLLVHQVPEGIFFFTSGAILRINRQNLLTIFRRFRYPSYVLSLVFLTILVFSHASLPVVYDISRRLFIISGIVALFNLTAAGLAAERLGTNIFLSKSSFFIYASHGILILDDIAHYVLLHLFPAETESILCLKLFLKPTLTVGICLLLYYLLGRIMPRTLSTLTGNRVVSA